jgi:hypothetical protein
MTTKNSTDSAAEKCAEFIRKTYYGNSQSDEDIAAVCRKYNLSDKSDAIRVALNLVATSDVAQLPQPTARRGRPPARTG